MGTSIIVIVGVILIPIAGYVVLNLTNVLCKVFKKHTYAEAKINDEGYWETACMASGCKSKKVIQAGKWKDSNK